MYITPKYPLFQAKNASLSKPKSDKPDNPNAFVFTTIDWFKDYIPENAYRTEADSFFWGKYPEKGHEFFVIFERPWKLERITIETGRLDKNEDLLYSGVLEASPKLVSTLPDMGTNSGRCNCTNYVELGKFDGGQLDLRNVTDIATFPIKCLRIRLTENQDEWVIIYRIAIYIAKSDKLTLAKSQRNSKSWRYLGQDTKY